MALPLKPQQYPASPPSAVEMEILSRAIRDYKPPAAKEAPDAK